jgi:hypothetical protein
VEVPADLQDSSKKIQPFVAAIVATDQPFQTACVTIEQAVIEPRHWIELLTRYSLPPRYEKGVSVTAAGQQEIEAVLAAAFSDWVDFVFVPSPTRFVIYADHDEYTTFYAQTRSALKWIAEVLTGQGFETITGMKGSLSRVIRLIVDVKSP